MNGLFEQALRDVHDSDMVSMTIQNQVNQMTNRRKDQLSGDVTGSVFERVSQSNTRFNAVDTLVVNVYSVEMAVGFGKRATKSMGRPLSVMAHLKHSIVLVKSEENCVAHAIIIAISRVDKDPNYKA